MSFCCFFHRLGPFCGVKPPAHTLAHFAQRRVDRPTRVPGCHPNSWKLRSTLENPLRGSFSSCQNTTASQAPGSNSNSSSRSYFSSLGLWEGRLGTSRPLTQFCGRVVKIGSVGSIERLEMYHMLSSQAIWPSRCYFFTSRVKTLYGLILRHPSGGYEKPSVRPNHRRGAEGLMYVWSCVDYACRSVWLGALGPRTPPD